MRPIILLAALVATVASPAWAQLAPADQRIQDLMRTTQQIEQDQRATALENRVFELEQQRRTDDNMRQLEEQRRGIPTFQTPPFQPYYLTPSRPLSEATGSAETIAATTARLKEIAEELNKSTSK